MNVASHIKFQFLLGNAKVLFVCMSTKTIQLCYLSNSVQVGYLPVRSTQPLKELEKIQAHTVHYWVIN